MPREEAVLRNAFSALNRKPKTAGIGNSNIDNSNGASTPQQIDAPPGFEEIIASSKTAPNNWAEDDDEDTDFYNRGRRNDAFVDDDGFMAVAPTKAADKRFTANVNNLNQPQAGQSVEYSEKHFDFELTSDEEEEEEEAAQEEKPTNAVTSMNQNDEEEEDSEEEEDLDALLHEFALQPKEQADIPTDTKKVSDSKKIKSEAEIAAETALAALLPDTQTTSNGVSKNKKKKNKSKKKPTSITEHVSEPGKASAFGESEDPIEAAKKAIAAKMNSKKGQSSGASAIKQAAQEEKARMEKLKKSKKDKSKFNEIPGYLLN